MEGKAPSAALAPVFARFKAWLTHIYKTLAGLNISISPEMRGVFDRLLATDDEIARASQSQIPPLFKSAKDAGMTDAEFAAYVKSVAKARDTAETTLLEKVMGSIRRQKEAWWKAEEKPIREEVSGAVARQPEYQALSLLRTGRLPDVEGEPVRMKLDRDAVAAILGSDTVLDMMPAGTLAREGGVHPDSIADLAGFRSGDDLVRALAAIEAKRRALKESGDNRSPQRYDVDEEVRARMEARHGDPLHDGSIEAEAMAAIHNDKALETMATELRALARGPKMVDAGKGRGRAAVGDVTPLEVVRRWAARAIGEREVRDATRVNDYARAEAKAGRAAEAAILKGDREEAFRQKQQQLVNHALFIEATKAKAEVDSAVKLLDRYGEAKTIKSLDQGYLDQIQDLIARFDFGRVSMKALEKRDSLRAWVESKRAEGFDPAVPDKLMDEAFSQHYSRMQMDDLRGLVDSVKSIAHIGRLKQKLIDAAEKREFQAIVDEMVQAAEKLPQIEQSTVRNPGSRGPGLAEFIRHAGDATKHALKSMDASLIKMDQMFQWLDGRDSNGPFQRTIMRRLSDAQTREHDLQTEYAAKLKKLGEDMPATSRKAMSQRLTIDELTDSKTGKPSSMLKSELLAIALNTGNESNLDKLARGEKWGEASIRAALDRHMTEADWHFVQGVWDTVEGLWPETEALEKRLNGVAPEKIVPRQVLTPFGAFKGGYYPVVYDPLRGYMGEKNASHNADALFQNNYVRAATSQGHTVERTGAAAPLHLSLDVLPRHLQQVIHDIAWREAVMDVDRITANKEVRAAIDGAMGPEYRQQIRPWLQSIANDKAYDPRGLAFWDKIAHWARTNATVVGLGFRLSTIAVHGSGAALNSIGEVGIGPMTSAVSTFIKDPRGSRDFVFEKSGEMRNRLNEVDRDMREAMAGDLLGQSGALATVRRASMMGVAMIDMASALPTWLARYTSALKDGMADQDAVYAADLSVRNAHGAGAAKDHAAIQRGSEFQKLFTMFYSFWNHLYNRQRDMGRMARQGDFASLLGKSFFYLVAPPIIHGLMSGGAGTKDDDQSWGGWAAEHIALGLAGGVPILRDLVGVFESGRDYGVTPAAGGVQKVGKAAMDVGHALGLIEGDVSDKWVKHAIETPGYIFGLPTGQASGAGQYLWDVWRGDEDPEGVADFLRGLMYGPKHEPK
jgi:hypothetical protein